MRFLVLGAGGLGGFFGGKLLRGGADVTFLVRPNRAAQLRQEGLLVRSYEGEIRTPVRVIQQEEVDASYDVVLLCCKAYDIDSAVAVVGPAVVSGSTLFDGTASELFEALPTSASRKL